MKMKRVITDGPGYCAVTEDGILVEYIRKDDRDQSGSIKLYYAAVLFGELDGIATTNSGKAAEDQTFLQSNETHLRNFFYRK